MALGRRRAQQQSLLVATTQLPKSPGHPFYEKLNALLRGAKFDQAVEKLCEPFYANKQGRPSIPPGVYFRMLFIGYFEGISSQRGIAWRCADSRSLQSFLGIDPAQRTPEHSSLSVIRARLPLEVHEQVFAMVLTIASQTGILKGRTLAVDATTLEANAAMKSIVRRDTGDNWNEYLRELAKEAGIEEPTDEDLRRFDRKRGNKKKVSNKEWVSKTDGSSRITKMKDGSTHLAYKAEHAVDVESDIIVSAKIHSADQSDAKTAPETISDAQAYLTGIGHELRIMEVVADKGYHSNDCLIWLRLRGIRGYIPERKCSKRRRWRDKPEGVEAAFRANRRRVKGQKSKRLQRLRSEKVERSFAHVCGTGGGRRTWLRGFENIQKRYLCQVAACNLGKIMLQIFGCGTPRGLGEHLKTAASAILRALLVISSRINAILRDTARWLARDLPHRVRCCRSHESRPAHRRILCHVDIARRVVA
jgi:transposase